jgi:hypothetical protein
MDANMKSADRRRSIIEAAEIRLSVLRDADPPAKTGGSTELDACKTMKRGKPYRSRTFSGE